MGICASFLNNNNKSSEQTCEKNEGMFIEENNPQQNVETQNSSNDIQAQGENRQNCIQPNPQQQNNHQQNCYQQNNEQKKQQNIEGMEENGEIGEKEQNEENQKKLENGEKEKKEEKGENEKKKEKGEIGKKEQKEEEKNEEKEKKKEKENEGKKEEGKEVKEEEKEEKEKKEKKEEKEEEKEKEEKEEEKEEKFIIEKDFDYSLLDKLLEKADKNKENIILLTTGSYNPIHRMHLEILNIATNFILSLNDYNVLCGFISPSADCYVKHKKPPLIPFDYRCKIIKTAIDEYYLENNKNENDHIKIFLHTWEGSHDYFIDFPYVIEEIQNRLLEKNITLIYVCGLDLFINCRYYFSQNVIAVDRKPYKNKYKDIPGKFIYIIKDEKTEPYSSTFIRDCFVKKDYQSIEKVTFPKVAKMIIEFYKDNFK